MQKQLFPSEIIQHTTEAYLPKVTVKSQLLYTIILLAIIGIKIYEEAKRFINEPLPSFGELEKFWKK
jgi:hypothetical protein